MREPTTHELKCDRGPFQDILRGRKKAEVRRDNRDFRVGDKLNLLETVNTAEQMRAGAPLEYTGGQELKVVTHVQRGYGLPDGVVVLSFDAAPEIRQAEPVAWYRDERVDTNEDSQGLPPDYISYRKVHAYTASRETMRRLAELGVVQSLGKFGRYGVTAFGSWVIDSHRNDKLILPLRTIAEHNAALSASKVGA